MNKFCISVGMIALGWVDWWIRSPFGLVAAFILSGAGSMVGVYIGWRISRDYLS